MTFGEIKKTVDEYLAQNPNVKKEDIADMFIEKQEEWGLPDLDLGVLLASIGAGEKLTEPMIKAMQEKGLLDGGEEKSETSYENKEEPETETENESESEKKPEPETEKDDEDKEKDDVRKLYNGE